jgi:hypothetical protein
MNKTIRAEIATPEDTRELPGLKGSAEVSS